MTVDSPQVMYNSDILSGHHEQHCLMHALVSFLAIHDHRTHFLHNQKFPTQDYLKTGFLTTTCSDPIVYE